MDTYQRKQQFIERELTNLLCKCSSDILGATYEPMFAEGATTPYMEQCIVVFASGSTKAVNVTMDSHAAIVRDVMEALR